MFDPRIDSQGAQSLADLMGGGSAAQYLGGQQAMIEQMNPINRDISLADLDRLTLANDHNRTMNPMLQQVQRAAVREADSKTPEYFTGVRQGELGEARSKVAKAVLDEGTLSSNISAKNSANQTQMIKDMGNNMLNVVAYIGGQVSDPAEQRNALAQLITHHGWDKNPATKGIWDKLLNSPNMLLEAQNLAERLRDFDPKHLGEMEKVSLQGQNNLDVANANGRWHLAAANARKGEMSETFKKEWMKLDDARKASVLDTLISEAEAYNQTEIELPDGTKRPVEVARQLAKKLTERAISRTPGAPQIQAPGLNRTDPRQDVMNRLYPNGNGTGGAVPLADPLGIRK